jgi:hypothetical protein
MRRFDKTINIEKTNLLAEQRYLQSKGIVTESSYGYEQDKLLGMIRDEFINRRKGRGSSDIEFVFNRLKEIDPELYNSVVKAHGNELGINPNI